jgi:hypothetical protein
MLKYFIFIFLGFTLITSCASKDEKLKNFKDYVQKISTEIKYKDGFNTIKVFGESRSIFRSYFLNGELVFINEDVSIGDRGTSVNQYYFNDNKLIRYNQKTILMRDDSLNIKTKTMIVLGMFLDGKTVFEPEYWIGDIQSVIVENDIDRIINHGELLSELAFKNRPEKKQ